MQKDLNNMKIPMVKSIEEPGLRTILQQKIDNKTKPLGSLGRLEKLAMQAGLIQQTDCPVLQKPQIIVFAADHGIAKQGVSAFPQEVTHQMVLNFLMGGAAINVFCRNHGIDLKIVDAGVNDHFPLNYQLINAKVGFGTNNFLYGPALGAGELKHCWLKGEEIIEKSGKEGCNVIGFGEMGIGNTSSASLLMSTLLDLPIADCVGRGSGLDDQRLKDKLGILQEALCRFRGDKSDPLQVLEHFGGFEIVMMTSAMLHAAKRRMILLIDGFIASAAFLCAQKLAPEVTDYSVFTHLSNEQGHRLFMKSIGASPLLQLDMRLGEGTGCALAYPILRSAVSFLNEMSSFEQAGVSQS